MRLSRLVLASLVLTGVLALTGCSDVDRGGKDRDDTAPSTTGAMTQAEVEAALLPVGSEAGSFEIRETPMAELLDAAELGEEECQPLSSLVQVDPEPATSARRSAGGQEFEDLTVQIQLLSYGGDGASDVFGQIEEAVTECADGYPIDPVLANSSARSVEPLAAPRVEAAAVTAYRVATDVEGSGDGDPLTLWSCVAVALDGQQLLLFQTQSLVEEQCTEVPAEVVDAQWAQYVRTAG